MEGLYSLPSVSDHATLSFHVDQKMATLLTGQREPHSGNNLMEIFDEYDLMAQEASHIDRRKEDFATASKQHEECSANLAQVQKETTETISCIEEQTQRIKLVSKHWFYGTTAPQPQLWLRGGCEGKIQRAQAKLELAEQKRPRLEAMVASCLEKEQSTRQMMEEAKKTLAATEQAQRRAQELREGLIQQNPTPVWTKLQQQSEEIEQGIQKLDEHNGNLSNVRKWIQSVKKIATLVDRNTHQADAKLSKASKMEEEKDPTPNQQDHHCCSDGRNHAVASNGGIRHGNRMQDGSTFRQKHFPKEEKLRREKEARERAKAMREHRAYEETLDVEIQRKCEEFEQRELHRQAKMKRLQEQASSLLEEAYKELDRGDELLRRIEKGLHDGSRATQVLINRSDSGSSCACGTLASQGRQLRIRANRMTIHADEMENELNQKAQHTNNDVLRLQKQKDKILVSIAKEEEAIFQSLRQSAFNKGSDLLSDADYDDCSVRPPPINPALLPTAPFLDNQLEM